MRAGTSSCRGAVMTLRAALIEQGVIQTGEDGVEFFCEPQKDLFASEGMPDTRILDLVEEVAISVVPRDAARTSKLFREVAKGAMWGGSGPMAKFWGSSLMSAVHTTAYLDLLSTTSSDAVGYDQERAEDERRTSRDHGGRRQGHRAAR